MIASAMLTMEDITVPPPEAGEVVDPREWFGAAGLGHVELEIGCGKGGFLLRQARGHPERCYVGIEWANAFYRFAADRMARWGVSNVRILRTDARNFVVHHLAAASIQALHVYHPDPWPKKRHHKRRLFQPDFVAAAIRSLAPGARWAVQTDHAEYFEWMSQQLAPHVGRELDPVAFGDIEFGVGEDETTGTNFEVKYQREGREFYRSAFRRV